MISGANVHAIHSLEELRSALVRFGAEAQEALQAMERETRRTMVFLAEAEARWKREVRRRDEIIRQATTELVACQASGYRDKEGRYHPPDCRTQEQTLLRAKRHLAEAQAKLREVRAWIKFVQQAAEDFQRQARRLAGVLNEDRPKATAHLERKVDMLRTYTALTAPTLAARRAVTSASAAPPAHSPDADATSLTTKVPPRGCRQHRHCRRFSGIPGCGRCRHSHAELASPRSASWEM